MIINGISILMIGASHLTYPGALVTTLHDALNDKGAQVHTFGVCGTMPSHWVLPTKGSCGAADRIGNGSIKLRMGSRAETVPIQKLVADEKPALLVVVMGDTLGAYKGGAKMSLPWAEGEQEQIRKEISAAKVRCVWVGPSWGEEGYAGGKTYARAQQVSKFLSTRVGPCTYIDSLSMSKPGEWLTLDGIHHRPQYYKLWAKEIVEELEKLE